MKFCNLKIGMVGLMLLSFCSAYAYDFMFDNLKYSIISRDNRTVMVAENQSKTNLKGRVEIPPKVIHSSITYTVTEIDFCAFQDCAEITELIIPNTVTEIGMFAFEGCSAIKEFNIPKSVQLLFGDSFLYCASLESIDADPENSTYTSIDGILFSKDFTSIIRYPCAKLKQTYQIPNTVTDIKRGAFRDCKNLTKIVIPNSVVSIDKLVFDGCAALGEIDFPSSITEIHRGFEGCDNIRTVYCHWDVPLSCELDFEDKVIRYATLYVPKGTKNEYEKVDPWRNFWNIEEYDALSSIDQLVADEDDLFDVYDIKGIFLRQKISTDEVKGLPHGIYILKSTNMTLKMSK